MDAVGPVQVDIPMEASIAEIVFICVGVGVVFWLVGRFTEVFSPGAGKVNMRVGSWAIGFSGVVGAALTWLAAIHH